MRIYNPFKRIKHLETQIDVLEGILDDKYRQIETYISLIEKWGKSLNEYGIKTEVELPRPEQIPLMMADGTIMAYKDGKCGEIVIVVDTSEHDRKVLEGNKRERKKNEKNVFCDKKHFVWKRGKV